MPGKPPPRLISDRAVVPASASNSRRRPGPACRPTAPGSRCCEPTWNETPSGSSLQLAARTSRSTAIVRVAAELARQRPVGAAAFVAQDAAEDARRRAPTSTSLSSSASAVEGERRTPQDDGVGDVGALLDRVAVANRAGSRRPRGTGRSPPGWRRRSRPPGHPAGAGSRRRVGLDRIEDLGGRQRGAQLVVARGDDVEVDHQDRGGGTLLSQIGPDLLLQPRLLRRGAAECLAVGEGRWDGGTAKWSPGRRLPACY